MHVSTQISRLVAITKVINDPFKFFSSNFPFTPLEFEHFCAFLLEKTGHEILKINNVIEPDGGIDIISKKNNLIVITQVKKSDWNPRKNQRDYICLETLQRHLGVVALKELEFKLKYGRQCEVVGYFMTLKNFSKPAITAFANEPRMKLFNLERIQDMIKEKNVLSFINNYREDYVPNKHIAEPVNPIPVNDGAVDVNWEEFIDTLENWLDSEGGIVKTKDGIIRKGDYIEKLPEKIKSRSPNNKILVLLVIFTILYFLYEIISGSLVNRSQNQANASNISSSNSSSKSVDYSFSQKEVLKTSSSSYSDIGVPFNSWIAGSIQKTYTRQGDSVNVNSFSYSSSLFLSTSFSLSSSASSLSSENYLFNSSIQSLSSKNKIENFVGKIGNQPIEINIDPVSTIKDKIIYKSGVIKYIKAANTPIPIDYMEVNDVECEDSFSLCSSIIIQEKVENGGQIIQTTILNKQSKEKKIGNWQWQSQGGDIIYDVIWDNEIFPN